MYEQINEQQILRIVGTYVLSGTAFETPVLPNIQISDV
jgi:hypothetical protein